MRIKLHKYSFNIILLTTTDNYFADSTLLSLPWHKHILSRFERRSGSFSLYGLPSCSSCRRSTLVTPRWSNSLAPRLQQVGRAVPQSWRISICCRVSGWDTYPGCPSQGVPSWLHQQAPLVQPEHAWSCRAWFGLFLRQLVDMQNIDIFINPRQSVTFSNSIIHLEKK